MGSAGGENVLPSLSRAHLQDGAENVDVGHDYGKQRADKDRCRGDGRGYFSNVNMATRKLQVWEEVTEKMVDFFGPEKDRFIEQPVKDEAFMNPPR